MLGFSSAGIKHTEFLNELTPLLNVTHNVSHIDYHSVLDYYSLVTVIITSTIYIFFYQNIDV